MFCILVGVKLTIINKGAHIIFDLIVYKWIFHKALKDGIFAICYFQKFERASISFLMLSAKQVNYWYHF